MKLGPKSGPKPGLKLGPLSKDTNYSSITKDMNKNTQKKKSKMSVLPNPKCRFYQIQSVSFTKSKMSVLPNP